MAKDTFFCPKKTLNFRGKIKNLSVPLVMGVMNLTPDSFYDGGRYRNPMDAIRRAEQVLSEGADIIDMGAASTRPGAGMIDPAAEQQRLLPALKAVRKQFPEAIISIDTYHASTARTALDLGAHMINDVSSGRFDASMFATIAAYRVPYVIMHMPGTPENMQLNPRYKNLIRDIANYFSERVMLLNQMGISDLIIDPGFGFGKTIEDNYRLMAGLDYFSIFGLPVMVGISRKSMINKLLKTDPADALNGSTVLNTIALEKGAQILRVHDVKEAVETIKIIGYLKSNTEK